MVLHANLIRSMVVVASFLSTVSVASTFSVEVGQTKVMGVSQRIVGITVRDPGVVEVRKLRNGSGVTLVGKEMGKTQIALRTVEGNEVEFVLYVTSEGARVFSTSRDDAPAGKKTLEAKKSSAPEPSPTPESIPETESEPTQVADTTIPPA